MGPTPAPSPRCPHQPAPGATSAQLWRDTRAVHTSLLYRQHWHMVSVCRDNWQCEQSEMSDLARQHVRRSDTVTWSDLWVSSTQTTDSGRCEDGSAGLAAPPLPRDRSLQSQADRRVLEHLQPHLQRRLRLGIRERDRGQQRHSPLGVWPGQLEGDDVELSTTLVQSA